MTSPLVGSGALSLDEDLGLEVSPMHGLANNLRKNRRRDSKGGKDRSRQSADVSELMKEVEADLGNPLRMSFGGSLYEECPVSPSEKKNTQIYLKKLDEKVTTPYRAVLDAARGEAASGGLPELTSYGFKFWCYHTWVGHNRPPCPYSYYLKKKSNW